jgi:phosphatidylinositol-3-phosphatase
MLLPLLSGCGGSSTMAGTSSSNTGVPSAGIPQVQHVVVVTLENANYADVIGSPSMPFLNSLLAKGSLAANYYANLHPSLPDYFIMTSGMTTTLDDAFTGTVTTDNVVRELTASGKTWKAYAESIPNAGYLAGDKGLYLRRHDPFSFFSDVQQSVTSAAGIVPFTQFATDLNANTLPNYAFVIPNELNDAHSCADGSTTSCPLSTRLQSADMWLAANMPPLLANAQFTSSGLLIITFDESANDFTNGGGHVPTVLLGTQVKAGYTGSAQMYDHRSLCALTMTALGATIPNGAGLAPQMAEFFGK